MKKTADVFGMSRKILNDSYVDRSQLDEKFNQYLSRDVHIVIRGASKAGKSWLRLKNINNPVIVQCRAGSSKDELYSDILSQLEETRPEAIKQERSFSASANLDVKSNIPLIDGKAGGKVDYKSDTATTYSYTQVTNSIQHIANIIKKHNRRIIIEDFHYLHPKVRKELAFDLKAFWELDIFIIIVGVWTQSNMLIFLNPDLSGRVEEIPVTWDVNELRQVAIKGGHALNIHFDDHFINELANFCYGSVGLFQVLILKCLDIFNIFEEQKEIAHIRDTEKLQDVCIDYAEALRPLYEQVTKNLAEGIRKRPDSTGIYAHALKAIFSFPDDDLINGISRDKIFHVISKTEPRIQSGNLHVVLCKFEDIQEERNKAINDESMTQSPIKDTSRLVISYNETSKEVSVVDRQILFYRKFGTLDWPWDTIINECKENIIIS
ncbi:hypothetical protein [Desulfovibrio sp. QI0442]